MSSWFRAEDADDVIACLFHGYGRWVGDGRTDAAANHDNGAEVSDLGRFPQRAHYVEQGIAGRPHVQQSGCLAHALDDDGDRARDRVRRGDRQRDAFARLVNSDDHKLPRLSLAGNTGSLDFKPLYIGRRKREVSDRKHGYHLPEA